MQDIRKTLDSFRTQLILYIAAALDQRERETWEAAAILCERAGSPGEPIRKETAGQIAAYCRAQAQEVGHESD